ncbi:MAG: hypothetical protein JJ714_00010 [Acidithiobacillus sp.]|nr:hypothetical protein [Acidithiobacillus sp.]
MAQVAPALLGAVALLTLPAATSPPSSTALASRVEAVAAAHHVVVTNWSGLLVYAGWQAVKRGTVGAVVSNVADILHQVSAYPDLGTLPLSAKWSLLNLGLATASLLDIHVIFVDKAGHTVALQRYITTPHSHFYLELLGSHGQFLSLVVIPEGSPVTVPAMSTNGVVPSSVRPPVKAPALAPKKLGQATKATGASEPLTSAATDSWTTGEAVGTSDPVKGASDPRISSVSTQPQRVTDHEPRNVPWGVLSGLVGFGAVATGYWMYRLRVRK